VNVHSVVSLSDKVDTVIMHKWVGIPVFLIVLWFIFQMTFKLGEIPMGWIESFFDFFGNMVSKIIPEGLIQSLIVDGIIAGVGGVIVFLPNILVLFFFISLLEDSGYMARAAFIMDKVMHSAGLHGKSFIPMLVGFGCSVPALMATRTLENKRDRYITMFIIPFMSCGAKLPVYILLAGAFFSPGNAGNVIFSIYLVGILLAFIVAKVLSVILKSSTSFVMELPPYRIPTIRSVFLHLWERAWLYIKKAGTIILMFSIIMWVLMTFPRISEDTNNHRDVPVAGAKTEISSSLAGILGRFIEPVLKPLGFDWRIGVALVAGFAAKEVVVSSLGTIYSINYDDTDETTDKSLKKSLRDDPLLNPVKAYGLMLFILIYVPCIAALSVLRRESGGWKWVFIMVFYTSTIAWTVTFAFMKIAQIFLN